MRTEINEVIGSIVAQRKKISKEKTMRGRALYSPKDMNMQFREAFYARGYSEIRDTYTITIPNCNTNISGAYKQIDFVKGQVLVEVQFGKYAFMFYDMAKFQYFFNENKADGKSKSCPAMHFTDTCQLGCPMENNWSTISNASSDTSPRCL